MREDNENEMYKGEGIRGWGWGLFGVATAAAAKYVMGGPGGIGGLFGGPAVGPGAPVSREILDLKVENVVLKAQAPQIEINATQTANIRCLADRVSRLESLTQVVVPNGNVSPGWGSTTVIPAPVPAPTAPDIQTLANAIATTVAAQLKTANNG